MRQSARFSFVFASLLAVAGCGSKVADTGVPQNIDMSKNYAPAAALPKMTPQDQSKAKSKAASAPTAAPAETPKEAAKK